MYIHGHTCISAQETFGNINLDIWRHAVDGKFTAREPAYEGFPPGMLRRMGKAVRMGVGAALPIVKKHPAIDGIIIGTANGGMEDCIKFLNQIIDYEEGMLTPGNFVQSTPNAIAAQLGLMTANKSYNITHVHRGLSFENALLDAMMLLKTYPEASYLIGGVDEISAYNYNIDYLDGWYRKAPLPAAGLFSGDAEGSIVGEGAAMFLVNNHPQGAVAQLKALQTIHSNDEQEVKALLDGFIKKHAGAATEIDMLITGENGDSRLQGYYAAVESLFTGGTGIARYKHVTGEFPTSSALALWLMCIDQPYPSHFMKRKCKTAYIRQYLLYNNYKGLQHTFMILQRRD